MAEETFWIGGATTWSDYPAQGARVLDLAMEEASFAQTVPLGANPTYVATGNDGAIVACNEVERGTICMVLNAKELAAGDATVGQTSLAPSDGAQPTYCCFVESRDPVVVLTANYGGGSLAVSPVHDFSLNAPSLVVQYEGSGPDEERQSAPHPHQVVVSGDMVLVPDLGCDQIHVHKLSDLLSGVADHRNIDLPAGSGPRHLVVDGDVALVACELSGLVRAVSLKTGAVITDASPTLKEDAKRNYPGPIALTRGGHVLVGNRGPDTIGVLRWDRDIETLEFADEFLCGGENPRDFALNGAETRLIVANQGSNNVAVMRFDDQAGSLTLTQTLATNTPTCVTPAA